MNSIVRLIFCLLLCGCLTAAEDEFRVVQVGSRLYNIYALKKNIRIIRISQERVEEIIQTEPTNPLALFVAASRGDADLTRRLLALGADPNRPTDFGHYPIHEAVGGGHAEVLNLLLAGGAQVNVRVSPNGPRTPNQWTPLHIAAHGGNLDITKTLVSKGAALSAKDFWGLTPLHYARKEKHDSLAAFLKAKGAKE